MGLSNWLCLPPPTHPLAPPPPFVNLSNQPMDSLQSPF